MHAMHIKSKFDAEFRRFSIPLGTENKMTYDAFRQLIQRMHSMDSIPFTLCYTSNSDDLLPITNNENFWKSFESGIPCLRLLIQRKGESLEERYGYGTNSSERRRKGFSILMPSSNRSQRRHYNISNPEDFRQVSAIIDVDSIPDTHRRVRLCKHGTDRPLGFYIRDGSTVRLTPQGAIKMVGIFISRLVEGGLAESTGLLGVNDEVVEVNGIDVHGKLIDQVKDMMIANAQNLIITIKPANQHNTLHHRFNSRQQLQKIQQQQHLYDQHNMSTTAKVSSSGRMTGDESDSDSDEVIDHRTGFKSY